MATADDVLDLAGDLFSAIGQVDGWGPCLERARRLFGCDLVQLLHTQMIDGTPHNTFDAQVGVKVTKDDIELLYELAAVDPRDPLNVDKPWHPGVPPDTPPEVLRGWRDGMPFTCRMFVTDEDLHRSRIYRMLLRPCGLEYTLLMRWFRPDDTVTTFGLLRSPEQGAWSEAERALLGRCAPFIREAADLHWRLLSLDFERRAALQVLDGLAAGVILLDAGARLVFANDTARAMIDRDDGMRVEDERLRLSDPAAMRELRSALDALIDTGPATAIGIERSTGAPNYVATVSSVRSAAVEASPLTDQQSLAVMLLADPTRQIDDAASLLRRLWGLTPTEARVLQCLLEGVNRADVAQRLAISVNTVKMHVKELFRKTRTRRQAQLVALVRGALGPLL